MPRAAFAILLHFVLGCARVMVKRLLIRAGSSYAPGDGKVVPVNSGEPVSVETEIGLFRVLVSIKNFDGSQPHVANSFYNAGDATFLNGSKPRAADGRSGDDSGSPGADSGAEPVADGSDQAAGAGLPLPNLRLDVDFTPKAAVKGSELLFGNDFMVPIKDYVPTTLLSTGLRFFTWFINSTVKGDVYGEKPFLYSPALNSFTYMSIKSAKDAADKIGAGAGGEKERAENLNSNTDNALTIPSKPSERKRFFTKLSHCDDFVFNDQTTYNFQFDTNFVKMADSKYSVSIPTYGNSTFDIDVLRYANEKLDNFNWTIKQGGLEGVGQGRLGLVVNFALENE